MILTYMSRTFFSPTRTFFAVMCADVNELRDGLWFGHAGHLIIETLVPYFVVWFHEPT